MPESEGRTTFLTSETKTVSAGPVVEHVPPPPAPIPISIPVPEEVVATEPEESAPTTLEEIAEQVVETVQDVAIKVEEVLDGVAGGIVGLVESFVGPDVPADDDVKAENEDEAGATATAVRAD